MKGMLVFDDWMDGMSPARDVGPEESPHDGLRSGMALHVEVELPPYVVAAIKAMWEKNGIYPMFRFLPEGKRGERPADPRRGLSMSDLPPLR